MLRSHPILKTILYSYRNNSEIMSRASIAGVVLLCPMLEVASESRPSYLVELVARFLRMIAGSVYFTVVDPDDSDH